MAWKGLTLTVEGRNALSAAQLSNRLNFKSIVVGDGAEPDNYGTRKELVHQLYEITDLHIVITENGCEIIADFPEVEYDYYFREVGLTATTDGGDILYVYDNCGDDAQYIVNTTGAEANQKRLRLSLFISDVDRITISKPSILYVTYDVFEEAVEDLQKEVTASAAGLMSPDDKQKLDSIEKGANKYIHPAYTARTDGLYKVTVDANGHVIAVTAVTKDDITALGIPGQDTDTTYSAATTSAAGLMSAEDKVKLNGIAAGAQVNSITGVKGNAEGSYRTGNVNITPANIGLGNVNNTADANKSVNYANSAGAVAWANVTGKPSTFSPGSHAHDDRYYTESEVNNLLNGKISTSASCNKNWYWSGQSGQPDWLWGGNDGTNMYVYNPSNFSVNYANSAGSAGSVAWGNVSGKPGTYPPSAHTHSYVPLTGGTDVQLNGNGAGYVRLLSSGEGGNIIWSKGSYVWEIDAYTDDARVMCTYGGSTKYAMYWYKDGSGIQAAKYDYISARKYKENIQDMTDEVARQVLKYRVCSYDYIDKTYGTDCLGMIADEVAEINTYPVTFKNGEPEALDYTRFIPQLIKMVQLQQNEIDSMHETINSQNNRIRYLEKEITTIKAALGL